MHAHPFTPRQSPLWPQAYVLSEDGGARTIGACGIASHLDVPLGIAAAARKAQLDAFRDFQKGESTLCDNDVWDARTWCYLDDASQLEPLSAWLRAQGCVDEEYDLDASWLMAHEVGFHNDPMHAHSGPFLVWLVAGPAKSVDFPQVGAAYPMEAGATLLFDGNAPHGLRLPQFLGQAFEAPASVCCPPQSAEDITIYISVEFPWTEHLERVLGIRRVEAEHGEYRVDPGTGNMTLCPP